MGKTDMVVVTGASKGIGRSIVQKYHAEGFHVIACARGNEPLQELKNELSAGPGRLDIMEADMSIKKEVDGFAGFVRSKGSTAILINNVGIFLPGLIIDEEEGQLEQMMDTNLYSAYYLTRALLPDIAKNGGHIFNICSTASVTAYENGGSYSITKYAMLGFSHNLREELKGKGVRVTAILPGNVLTPSWGKTEIPEDRFIKPEDVAESIFSISQLSPRSNVEELLIQPADPL